MKSFSTYFLSGAAIISAVSALATPQLPVEKRAVDGLPSGGVISNGVAIGFLPSDGYEVTSPAYTMAQINSKLGAKASTYGWYAQITGSTFDGSQLLSRLDDVVASGAVFQPAVMPITFSDITPSVASQVASVLEQFTSKNVEVWLRFGHEMNWYASAAGGTYHGTPAEFITAWKNVHAAVASNPLIKTWWSPNVDTASNPVAPWWPGASYVDIVGVDYYPSSPLSSTAFAEGYSKFYQTYSAANNIPFAIGETAFYGSDNYAWLSQLVSQDMCEYPNYIAASWFEYNKEQDYLVVEGSSSVLAQAQQLLLHNTKTGCGSGNSTTTTQSASASVAKSSGSTPTTLSTKTATSSKAAAKTSSATSATATCTWGCNGWDCSASVPCQSGLTCQSGYCH